MPTNEERREVARMLRELPGDSTYPDLIGVIADHDGWYPAADAADRLADLIEPPTQCPHYNSDRHYCSIHDVPAIDRDALLALADEMEEFGNLPVKHPGIRVLHNDDFSRELGYARRIREALGVEYGHGESEAVPVLREH